MNIEKFGLSEQPFVDVSVIDVSKSDKRVNGSLYAEKAAHKKLDRLLQRIEDEETVTYVSSGDVELGSGKSALMAATFWRLKQSKEVIPLWARATGSIAAGPTVGRIIDSMITDGYTEELRKKLGSFTFAKVSNLLSKYYNPPSTQISGKLAEILELPGTQVIQKITNVKRSLLTYSAVDFFGYFLGLFLAAGFPRFVIFVDQFEEYVQAHTTSAALQRLGDDFRDLIEGAAMKTSLVFSLHSRAEEILGNLGYASRVGAINQESKIAIDPLSPEDGVELAEVYLNAFRVPNFKGSSRFPFEKVHEDELAERHGGREIRLAAADLRHAFHELDEGAVPRQHERIDHDARAPAVRNFTNRLRDDRGVEPK